MTEKVNEEDFDLEEVILTIQEIYDEEGIELTENALEIELNEIGLNLEEGTLKKVIRFLDKATGNQRRRLSRKANKQWRDAANSNLRRNLEKMRSGRTRASASAPKSRKHDDISGKWVKPKYRKSKYMGMREEIYDEDFDSEQTYNVLNSKGQIKLENVTLEEAKLYKIKLDKIPGLGMHHIEEGIARKV